MATERKAGRKKGTPNRPTKDLLKICDDLDFHPFTELCLMGKGDWKALGYESEFIEALTPRGEIIHKPVITAEMRFNATKAAAEYVHPKRKALEHTGDINSQVSVKMSPAEIESVLSLDPFNKPKEDK